MDINDRITNIMYELFKNQEVLDILQNNYKQSDLILSVDLNPNIDNENALNVNIFKKMSKSEFIKTQLPKYKKVTLDDTSESCCICLENYTINTYKRGLQCNHHFHKKCIDKWITKCDDEMIHCPMCRSKYELSLDKIIDLDLELKKEIN